MKARPRLCYPSRGGGAEASGGYAAARLAAAAPVEPARARVRGRRLDEAPELPRDGALAAEPGDGAAPRRAARGPAARAERAAARRGLRADLRRALARGAGAAGRAPHRRPRAEGPRALPRHRDRPALEPPRRERGGGPAARRRRARAPRAARERAAREPPSRRPRAAHREPRRSGARTSSRACATRWRRAATTRSARSTRSSPRTRCAAPPRRPQAPRRTARSRCRFELATDDGVLSFLGTTTVFGTPLEITLAELALETFFPADAATADLLQRAGRARAAS